MKEAEGSSGKPADIDLGEGKTISAGTLTEVRRLFSELAVLHGKNPEIAAELGEAWFVGGLRDSQSGDPDSLLIAAEKAAEKRAQELNL